MANHTHNPVAEVLDVLHALGYPARFDEFRDYCCCDAHAREGLRIAKQHHRVTSLGRGSGTYYSPARSGT